MTTLTSLTPAPATTFELRSGPHTIAGPGESCLVCGDPLSRGEVYLFIEWAGDAGVAHEDCAEFEAAASATEQSCRSTAAPAAPDVTAADVTAAPAGGAAS
jgi:hypothetical protein